MRITESQLRRIIRQEVRNLHEAAGGAVRLGGLTASIPGDERYTDRLEVLYDPETDKVTVAVGESAAAGGMDTLGGGSMGFGGDRVTVPADPRSVMSAISGMLGQSKFLFKRYGKPTRNFRWETGETGLSAARVAAALDWARGGAL